MDRIRRRNPRRQAWWGVMLVALGVFFLLREFAPFDVPSLRYLWPAFVVAMGVVRLATFRSPDEFSLGLSFTLIGLWFFANVFGWWGFTYRTSWPVVLVIFGFSSVLRALMESRARAEGES